MRCLGQGETTNGNFHLSRQEILDCPRWASPMLAGALADPVVRDRMLMVADDYEKMAKTADALSLAQDMMVSELKLTD